MNHQQYMRRALDLAGKGLGHTSPNPMVGAVIVKNGAIIGEGWHERCGGLHAERNALASCTADPAGATMYVTLEPCCHHGRTPPCTDAILEHGISEVYVGSTDPNPLMAGKGVSILRNHGVQVETGILEEECDRRNEVFFHYITTRTPFVVMKYAMTADGKTATQTGRSRWITSEAARGHVHTTRHALSGIMVGIGTVLRDDPLLTCRLPDGKNPVRVICDSRLSIPPDSAIVRTAGEIPTIVAATSSDLDKTARLEAAGITVLKTASFNGRVDLKDLMRLLGEREIDSILLEGGGTLNESALSQGIVKKLQVYVGAKLFGGKNSPTPLDGFGVDEVAAATVLQLQHIMHFEDDVLLEYRLEDASCSQES